METQSAPIPKGWTNNPDKLKRHFAHNSLEAYQSRCFGIADAEIVLLGTKDMDYIITSGGRYYWGDLMLEDHLSEITRPTTFPGILNALATKGFRGLRLKTLKEFKIDEKPPSHATRARNKPGPIRPGGGHSRIESDNLSTIHGHANYNSR